MGSSRNHVCSSPVRRLLLLFLWPTLALGAQQPHPIDLADVHNPAQFSFLGPVLSDVEVVSLGESIHLTSEFPLVRVGIIRYLHQTLGFDMVAMEGSAEDIWVAQDRLLNSPRQTADAEQALSGLFKIWNTVEVRELIDFEVDSWKTQQPLYVAAYDIQPGTGAGTPGPQLFRALADRLRLYAPPPAGFNAESWVNALGTLTSACASYRATDSSRVVDAIATLDQWIRTVAPVVDQHFPGMPHATVLRMIPANLRASHALCRQQGSTGWTTYKETRDANASGYALDLKRAAPGGKLIVWAHLSHVFHNSEGRSTSVGQALHRALGTRLYTIMPFAESGFTTLIYSDVNDDFAYGPIRGTRTAAGHYLSTLADRDYFLDLRSVPDTGLLATVQPMVVESSTWPLTLNRDFDGIVWIKTVHSPTFLSNGMGLMLTALTIIHYRVPLLILVALLGGALTVHLVRRHRRRPSLAQ